MEQDDNARAHLLELAGTEEGIEKSDLLSSKGGVSSDPIARKPYFDYRKKGTQSTKGGDF